MAGWLAAARSFPSFPVQTMATNANMSANCSRKNVVPKDVNPKPCHERHGQQEAYRPSPSQGNRNHKGCDDSDGDH